MLKQTPRNQFSVRVRCGTKSAVFRQRPIETPMETPTVLWVAHSLTHSHTLAHTGAEAAA
eukprot:8982589-Pyramimonas_sp.AAC.1